MTSATDSDAVFRGIAEAATALLKAKMAWVWVADSSGETLRESASFGLPPAFAHLMSGFAPLPRGQGVAGAVLASKEPEFILDIQDDPRWLARQLAEAADLHTCAAVPLLKQDRAVGVLIVLFGHRPGFTAEEKELVSLLADQAAIAIENAALLEDTERRRREAEVVAELARSISGSLDLDTVLQRFALGARELCEADMARIALREPGSDAMFVRYRSGSRYEGYATIRIEAGKGSGGLVVRTGRPLRSDNYLADPRISRDFQHVAEAEGIVAHLAVPIRSGERTEGVLYVDNRSPRPFTDRDEAILSTLADNAAVAIQNTRLFAESAVRRRGAEAVAELGSALLHTLDPKIVAKQTTDSSRALLGARNAALYRLEDNGALASVAVSGQMGPAFGENVVFPPGSGAIGAAVRTRQPVTTTDVLSDDRLVLAPDLRSRIEQAGYRSVLSVPLFLKDGVIGALSVGDRLGRVFDQDEIRAMQTFAAQAALALENARLYADAERRRHEAETLAEIGRAFTQTLDPGVIAQTIADRVTALLELRTAVFFEILPDSGDLRALAVSGALAPGFKDLVFPRASGLAGLAVRERRVVTSSDLLGDPRIILTPEARSRVEAGGIRSGLSAPFIVGDELIGVLSLGDAAGRVFSESDVRSVEAIGDQAALALQNARLFRDAERRRREAEVMAELAQVISASLDLDVVLQRIADGAKDLVGSDLAGIALREPGSDALNFRYRVGPRHGPGEPAPVMPGTGIAGQVLLTGRPLRTDDYAADPRFAKHVQAAEKDEIVTAAGVPITMDDRVEGVLCLANRSLRPFTDRDESLLLRLADEAAMAIKNAQLFARQLESERRYRSLFENATDPIATFALDGTFTSVNPAVEQLTGYTRQELLGRHFSELARPDSAAYLTDRGRRARAGEKVPPVVEAVVVPKDGREVIVEGRFSQIRDAEGRLTGWQVIYRDLTERKRAERALRASEERYRTLVEGSLQGILIHRNFVTVFANSALATMLGYASAREMIGIDARCWIAPDEVPRLEAVTARRTGEALAPARHEVQGMRKDGSPIWADVQVSLITWDGEPAVQAAVSDITERRRAEETLRQQEGQLRQAQKMEAVGQLAGGIAHDFNNLLTVITGRGELLLRRLPSEDPARRDIELIKKTGERAAVLTRQLLAFSRKQVLQPRLLDLNQVVAGVAQMLQRLIGEHIDLVTALDPDLGRVRADPAQVEQIIVNLAVNARDAMPQGGRLRIETANVELDEAFVAASPGASAGAHAMLAVSDTGQGMTPEVQAHVFEPFFTTKEVGKGTGLGLATVYGIVKQHEGYITVESVAGAGTTLRIYLRRVEEPIERVEAGPRHPDLPPASETVLLVEDETDLRALATEILGGAGYAVLAAGGPVEAMERARRHTGPIHLLLTDVVMPEMSGRDLATRLTPAHPEMKVLYMSGYTADAIAHHGVLDPGTALLQKPFTPDALTRKVREILAS